MTRSAATSTRPGLSASSPANGASEWGHCRPSDRLTWPDSFYVTYDHLLTGETIAIRENGATSGIGVIGTYGYDAVSRLSSLGHDLGGTAYDLTLGFTYNPASQIVSSSRSNDAFAWLGHGSGSTASSANGLNQIAVHGGAAVGHDAKGNLTSDPAIGKTYGYSSENLLTSVGLGGGVTGTLAYDPLLRLYEAGVSQKTRIVHDGEQRIAEYYGAANAPMARFVNAPGLDEPLVEYQGTGLATRRWLHADERGSIVARSDDSGNLANVNTYDEQGRIGPTNAGRFHFAGQPYESLGDLYYARARMRNPRLGRFMQTDPIGYGDGMNLYAYVKGDPVNGADPSGLCAEGFVRVSTPTGRRGTDDGNGGGVVTATTACQKPPIHSRPAIVRSDRNRSSGGGVGGGGGGPILSDPNPDPRRDRCGNVLPPASRRYSVPPGYRENPADPSHHTVIDAQGRNAINPYYETARLGGQINWEGVRSDLIEISVAVVISQLTGVVMRGVFGPTRGSQIQAANRTDTSAEDAARSLGSRCSR